jgi:hypothetical protein
MTFILTFSPIKMNKYGAAFRLIGVGFFIIGSIILGMIGGIWLDGLFGTKILWLIGLITGIASAVWGVYRLLLPFLNDNNKGEH